MEIAAVTLCPDAGPIREDVVRHNAGYVDLQALACWPAAAEEAHAVLRECLADDLPVVLFDMPGTMRCDRTALATLLSNLERFFNLDAVVLLAPDELIGSSRDGLRATVEGTPAAELGHVALSEVDPGAAARSGAPPPTRQRRVLRSGPEAADVAVWLETLERWSNALGRLPLARGEPDVGATSLHLPGAGAQPTPRATSLASETGIWSSEQHRENLYLDLPPFRFVCDRYRPRSALDVGCGLGGYVAALGRWRVRGALGVDGFDATGDLICPPEQYRQHDLRQPLDLERTFDLVISTEVVEHVDERYEEVLIDNIAHHADRLILFSAARPGQPGVGHVNCKPIEHWLELWGSPGWVPNHFDTSAIRSLSTFHWFRRNLVLLVRDTADLGLSQRFEANPVGDVEIRRARWVGQRPAVHEQSFGEPLPSLGGEGATGGAPADLPSADRGRPSG